MKKVSIIVPVYNVERYLVQCIESLINQTYKNLQLILIDDGSEDNSGYICDKFAEKDNRVKVIHQKNAGAANAKNKGLDLATGEYITFIDSDDFVELDWIETLMQEMMRTNADVVECGMDLVFTDKIKQVEEFYDCERIFNAEEYLFQYLCRWTSSLFWNKLFKSELIDGIRFKNERRCIDDEFFTYKVISNAKKISRISQVLYHYRQRKSSVVKTGKNRLQITEDALEVLIERYEWIKGKFPQLKIVYLKHDMDFLIYFSTQGTYDSGLVKKYRKIARYYIKECIKVWPDKMIVVNALHLIRKKPDINTKKSFDNKLDNNCFI